MPETRKVKVVKRIFFSEETGYGVFKVSVSGSREQLAVVGNLFDVGEGDFLEITGDVVSHPRYGDQFRVTQYKSVLPEDRDGIIKYLSSRIHGVGKRIAGRIVDKFGDEVFDVLQNSPERLREVKGFRKSLVEEVRKSAEENKTLRELTVKLSPYGIGNETIFKIFKEFGDDAPAMLEQNAYLLMERVRGIGFKIADTIAMSYGMERDDINRIKAAIHFLLLQYEQQKGDLYVEEEEMIHRAVALLDVDDEKVEEAVTSMVERNELVREEIPEPVVLSYKNFGIEKMISRRLFSLAGKDDPLPKLKVDFETISKRISVTLTDEQKGAVESAARNRITIITGGPGTGKTTIIRAIIEAFAEEEQTVLIAAPTGRAAKRIEEASFYEASTIHRMLKVSPETRSFVHDQHNPLKADVVIVDEFSMVDVFLFHSLLKAISQHTRLIIIGDKDQLPSVGPGNVLRDVIHCGFFEIIYLNRNFRQTEDSLIIENAYRINEGEMPVVRPYADDLDFVYIQVNSDVQATEKVLRIIDYHREDYRFNSQDFQVLVPMYRGPAGIDAINLRIQEQFNTTSFLVKKKELAFKKYDKVMQLKNNYDKEVFNGEMGIISGYSEEKKLLRVEFDGSMVEYGAKELEELTLSYAVSVHKSQGSEYDMLILVMLPGHSIMLNRELFYTAVTRAKKKLFLISDKTTVSRAIFNASPSVRKTLLNRRLQEAFEPEEEEQVSSSGE